MKVIRIIGFVVGCFSFLVAFVSAFLSAAPFTPAVFAVIVTIPLAVIAILAGSKRTGWLAIYWSGCAVLAFFTLQSQSQMGSWALVIFYVCGFGLSAFQFIRYVRIKRQGSRSDQRALESA
ncbi:MAG: hypothetical protein VR73_14800 [Gammaproteobacteria bacterium BRH_c0]|nr:MAG: hypothetical protein VR73_14800 [Gammaproteobacteria bacterium BRH_c0]